MFTLLNPIWLILALPLGALWWLWRAGSPWVRYLRLAVLGLAWLAMCGVAWRLPSRTGTVVVVADRSLSMPTGNDNALRESIELLQRGMSREDQLTVVTFAQQASVERPPQAGAFAGFTNQIAGDASNLHQALDKAVALIAPDAPGRVVVLSDGRWTGADPAAVAGRAAARGIALDYRLMQRATANDLAITQLDAPVSVTPGEAFMLTAWVQAPLAQEVSYELTRNGQVLAAGKTTATQGVNRLTFRDLAGAGGVQSYRLRIAGGLNPQEDPQPENNTAKWLIGVQGPKPLLHVTSSNTSALARLLKAGGLNVITQQAAQSEWTLDALAQYSGVLLENVPASQITERGMETLATWVSQTGAGLMLTGGKNSYGAGGYFKSPLEPILPISMELRQEHRKFSLAIVVALDRSGSMAVPVAGGRQKMDLANLAAVQVLDLLTDQDEFGVVAVDSSSHIIADLAPVAVNKSSRSAILRSDSMGGGIFVYEALTTAAQMMLNAKAGAKHIVLFADAADSEEPGAYQALLARCEQAGITVSVIGLGKETDSDANLLRDIAKRGNGQCFFTESAEELPRLFAQDTLLVARGTFLEQATQPQFTGGLVALTGKQFNSTPMLGGYNLCYLRPQANLASVTTDEYNAPIVAAWQAGSGRVLCFTGEADGEFTGALAAWTSAGDWLTSLARWTAGEANALPNNLMLTQEVKNGASVIRMHLDPETIGTDKAPPITQQPTVTTLRAAGNQPPKQEQTTLQWTAADTLEATIPLTGAETALSAVEVPGFGRVALAPVTLPYSPEFKPVAADFGATALAKLAQATNGRERLQLADVWRDLPRRPRLIELAPYLLSLAVLLLLLEVLERQTGLVRVAFSGLRWPRWRKMVEPEVPRATVKGKAVEEVEPKATTGSAQAPAAEIPPTEILDALKRARQQAQEKTQR